MAAADERVEQALAERLEKGGRLTNVPAIPTDARNVFEVAFLIDPSDDDASPLPSFSAIVDLERRSVTRFHDTYVGGGATAAAGTLPLALAVPSQSTRVVTSEAALAPVLAREQSFLEEQGLAAEAKAGGFDTPTRCWGQTPIDTTTRCLVGDQPIPGVHIPKVITDTTTDYRGEAVDDFTNDIGPPKPGGEPG